MKFSRLVLIVCLNLSLLFLSACERKRFSVERPNVILLVLDTLRADHLSGYGYERATTPNLDAFAAANVKAEYALTAAPWTPASLASIMTGMYVTAHGLMPPNSREVAKAAEARLNSNLETLAEALKKYGYQTAGITSNPWTSEEFNFQQGFDHYRFRDRAIAEEVNKNGIEMIEQMAKESQPFFIYMHYLDPHDPYSPPKEYKEKFSGKISRRDYEEKMQRYINLYDGEINYLDTELGKLFEWLKSKGLYENAMIVIVADHGEQFMEHGDHRHGYKLYNDEVHVPLLFKSGQRGESGRLIKDTVSTIDVFPTILDRVGIKLDGAHQGVSLLDQQAIEGRSGVLSEIRRWYNLKSVSSLDGKRLILKAPMPPEGQGTKDLISEWHDSELVGVFDRFKDYMETAPLDNQGLISSMRVLFDSVFGEAKRRRIEPAPQSTGEISDSTLDKLKSLGYIQ